MDAQFPLLAFEKDDHPMHLLETPEGVLSHLEAIDMENDEYLFWDSTGASLSILVVRGQVKQIAHCEQSMSLREAFETYSKAYGGESAIDTWKALQSQLPCGY